MATFNPLSTAVALVVKQYVALKNKNDLYLYNNLIALDLKCAVNRMNKEERYNPKITVPALAAGRSAVYRNRAGVSLLHYRTEPVGVDSCESVGWFYLRVALEDAGAVLIYVPTYVNSVHLTAEAVHECKDACVIFSF